jgi:hypothetical protein
LKGHLENPNEDTDAPQADDLPDDAQLVDAYHLLRAMQLLTPAAPAAITE